MSWHPALRYEIDWLFQGLGSRVDRDAMREEAERVVHAELARPPVEWMVPWSEHRIDDRIRDLRHMERRWRERRIEPRVRAQEVW